MAVNDLCGNRCKLKANFLCCSFGKSGKLIFAARNSIRVQQFARYLAKLAEQNSKNALSLSPSGKMLDYCIIYRLYGKLNNAKTQAQKQQQPDRRQSQKIFMQTHTNTHGAFIELCCACISSKISPMSANFLVHEKVRNAVQLKLLLIYKQYEKLCS